MIKHIGATLKKLIMLAFGMWSGTMMDDARCGCSDLCFYPLNHQFRWRLLRTKNPRLRIPTLSPEFYDIDFSVSRGQTFAIFLADFMKLFSPELWPQKIQISEATNMSIEIYHLSSENGDKRVVGCQQKKRVSSFSAAEMMAHHMFNFNPGLYFVRWQAHHVHQEIPLLCG